MFNGCDSGTQRDCLKNKFSVREVLYIGGEADTSDDNPIISFVVDAVSDNFGNIYIFDPITQYIHSYDYNGYYRWTVGGKGHAPGEFQHITSMYTDDDNYLYVYDSRRSILTVFDMNGEMLGYQAIEPSITFHITKKDFHKRSHMSGYHPTMRGYYVHYEYHSISFGMYKTKLDTMLHLSYLADGDGMRLVVEYFEMKDMSLGRYAIIDILDIDFNPHQHPVWVDKDGYIFIADNTEFPKLRKLKLIHEK